MIVKIKTREFHGDVGSPRNPFSNLIFFAFLNIYIKAEK